MIHTLTIDIINDKAVKLLHDLELQKLIRVHKEITGTAPAISWAAKYKGAMQKQPLNEIDHQLNDLRNAWE